MFMIKHAKYVFLLFEPMFCFHFFDLKCLWCICIYILCFESGYWQSLQYLCNMKKLDSSVNYLLRTSWQKKILYSLGTFSSHIWHKIQRLNKALAKRLDLRLLAIFWLWKTMLVKLSKTHILDQNMSCRYYLLWSQLYP